MTPREAVLDAFRAACSTIDIAGRVRAAAGEPSVVIAAGKAATAMMAGVSRFDSALVVLPHGAREPDADSRVTVVHAAHPLPDASSVNAAERALAVAGSPPRGERLFLISGGASSLLCAPAEGLTLARKREVNAVLLHAEATITEVNVVRRHLSRIKGGGLARVAQKYPRRTLIVSDVIGGGAQDVGSGPSVEDPTTIEDGRAVGQRFELGPLPWVETWKEREHHEVLATPEMFAALVQGELAKRGLRDATVVAAEPPLRVPPNAGRGGRCTHVAAKESLTLPARTLFAAIATDGVDGSSGTGGAIVLGPLEGAREALERWDTGPLHIAAGTAIAAGPTGLNFADLHVRARY